MTSARCNVLENHLVYGLDSGVQSDVYVNQPSYSLHQNFYFQTEAGECKGQSRRIAEKPYVLRKSDYEDLRRGVLLTSLLANRNSLLI